MPVPNHKIHSLATFQAVTQEPRQIAGLYFYQLLDCLIDLAYKISADFRKRPQLYRDLGNANLAPLLAKLNAKYGTEVTILSASERNEIYAPIFGASDSASQGGSDTFRLLRNALLKEATTFAQGAQDHSLPMLREAVRTAHRPFKDYLIQLQGNSVRFSKDVALSELTEDVAYGILRSANIAAIFGVTNAAGVEYPYATDPARDLLVEQIDLQLAWRVDTAQGYGKLTRDRISTLQRAALRGAEAIATVIDFGGGDDDADVDLLITKCHVWGTVLTSLNGRPSPSQPPTQQPPPMQARSMPATAPAYPTIR